MDALVSFVDTDFPHACFRVKVLVGIIVHSGNQTLVVTINESWLSLTIVQFQVKVGLGLRFFRKNGPAFIIHLRLEDPLLVYNRHLGMRSFEIFSGILKLNQIRIEVINLFGIFIQPLRLWLVRGQSLLAVNCLNQKASIGKSEQKVTLLMLLQILKLLVTHRALIRLLLRIVVQHLVLLVSDPHLELTIVEFHNILEIICHYQLEKYRNFNVLLYQIFCILITLILFP